MFLSLSTDYILHCNTWTKDAHSLFDYESETINPMKTNLGPGGKLHRNEDTHETTYTMDDPNSGFFLTGSNVNTGNASNCWVTFFNEYGKLKCSKKWEESYIYNKDNIVKVQDMLWICIGQTEIKGIRLEYVSNYKYKFKINDLIRFGRVQFVVRNMNMANNICKNKEEDCEEGELLQLFKYNDNDCDISTICSHCKKVSDTDSNPILKICKCKAGISMHLDCFKSHLKTSKDYAFKETFYNNKTLTLIHIYNFICSFCNEPFNAVVTKRGNKYNILPYNTPGKNNNFLILESLNFVREGIYSTLIMIFLFPNKNEEFFLGRGHEATFKISDISISRVHSKIFMENGCIHWEDLGSKFGTMVLLRKNLSLEDMISYKIKIQIGRSVFWWDEVKNTKHDSDVGSMLEQLKVYE